MKMNLKGWKKVSSEKNHTILRNSHGHELKIVHKSLSKDNQDALDSLPNYDQGGTVQTSGSSSSPPEPDPKAAKEVQAGATASGWQPETWKKNLKAGLGLAKGGEVKGKYEDTQASNVGKPPEPEFDDAPEPEFEPKPNFDGDPNKNKLAGATTYAKGGSIKRYADGGDVQADEPAPQQPTVVINTGGAQQPQPPQATPAPTAIQGIDKASSDLQSMGKPGVQAPAPTAGQQLQQASPDDGSQALTSAPQIPTIPDPASLAQQGADADVGVGNAVADQDIARSKMASKDAGSMQKLQDTFNKNYNDRITEIQNLAKDIQNPKNDIDYNRYLGSMDTGKRISTSIGLILGGIGSGLAGGSNPALDLLNNTINRDVDQQKAQLGKKQTLYSENLKLLGDQREAYQTTAMQMHYKTDLDMQAAALKSGSPVAIANAKKTSIDNLKQWTPVLQQQAMKQTLMEASKGGDPSSMLPTLRAINPEAAKTMEEHMIPGIKAQTSVPVPNDDRSDITAKQNLIDGAERLRQFVDANTVGGKLDPSKRAYLQSRSQELEQLYGKAVGASKSAEEREALQNIIGPNPSAIFASETYSPKLKGLSDAVKEQLAGKYNQFGVPQEAIPAQYRPEGVGPANPQATLPPGAQAAIKFAQHIQATSKDPNQLAAAARLLKTHNIQ